MNRIYPVVSLLLFCLSFLYYSCKKKEKEIIEPQTTTKQSDQSGAAAADGAIDDVNDFISNQIGGGSNARIDVTNGRLEAYNLPCGVVSVDTTTKSASGSILYKMKYGNQTPCGYKKKSGQVAFQLTKGNTFYEKGSEYTITLTDYKVEILSSGDIVTLTGSLRITNVKGGYIWYSITDAATIQHQIRGTFSVTYANGEVRQRSYYQLRTWASNNGWQGLSFTVTGDTSIANATISEIGRTLEGNYSYQTSISEDYIWKNCGSTYIGPYVLLSGRARMNVLGIPGVTTAYFDVEAGYAYDLNDPSAIPVKTNNCNSSNAYKILIMIDKATSTQYQLY